MFYLKFILAFMDLGGYISYFNESMFYFKNTTSNKNQQIDKEFYNKNNDLVKYNFVEYFDNLTATLTIDFVLSDTEAGFIIPNY